MKEEYLARVQGLVEACLKEPGGLDLRLFLHDTMSDYHEGSANYDLLMREIANLKSEDGWWRIHFLGDSYRLLWVRHTEDKDDYGQWKVASVEVSHSLVEFNVFCHCSLPCVRRNLPHQRCPMWSSKETKWKWLCNEATVNLKQRLFGIKLEESDFLLEVYVSSFKGFMTTRTGLDQVISRFQIPQNRWTYWLRKWTKKGWWDYGVSLAGGWLTEAGKAKALEVGNMRVGRW